MSGDPWLMVVDMQHVFADPDSPWASPDYPSASAAIRRLRPLFGRRVALTRFVAPEVPRGSWVAYYQQWPFALDPARQMQYNLMPEFPVDDATVISRPTFNKWDAQTRAALGDTDEIVLTGVATDCCVISTALVAADDGVHVRLVADACGGSTKEDHDRAVAVMALYGPMIEVTTVEAVLAQLAPTGGAAG